MRTIIFSNPKLLDKLRARQLTMTIRSEGYVKRNRIKEAAIVKIIYKRGSRKEFIGFAEVTKIEKTTMKQLTSRDAEKCGYTNIETLKTWIKIFNRFKTRENMDELEILKIKFKWVLIKTLKDYLEVENGKVRKLKQ